MEYYLTLITPKGIELDYSVLIGKNGELEVLDSYLDGTLKSNAVKVFCTYSLLTSIDAPNARSINCRNNQLTSINAPNAEIIDCANNQLTSINAPNARYINCRNNQLKSIIAPNADAIDCANNQLTSIDAPNAMIINCDDNPLQALVEDCGKCKNQIWSQKVDDVIYTYINCERFTLKEAIAAINEEYEGKEAADYIEKVKLSQSKAA